jgi:predicted nucleotidyltransferase
MMNQVHAILGIRAPGDRRARPQGARAGCWGKEARRSDIDVLKRPPTPKFSLLDLARVRVELGELLGRDTDVVIREDALPSFWQTIENDLVEVF